MPIVCVHGMLFLFVDKQLALEGRKKEGQQKRQDVNHKQKTLSTKIDKKKE